MRGDDAAALLAAEALPADIRNLAEIVEIGQLAVEALLEVSEATAVVVADAAVGVAPGLVVTLCLERVAAGRGGGAAGGAGGAAGQAGGSAGPAPLAASASSHSLPPDQVLALAAELRGSMPRGVFVGIGGAEFGFGEGVSAPVAAGLAAFTATLAKEIRRLAGEDEPL